MKLIYISCLLLIKNNNKRKNMNKLKKIGMTALAASLVSTSVFAGEMSVSGTASMSYENYSKDGANLSNAKYFTQNNNIVFSGGGELDNGLTVALSFELDDGYNNSTASTSVWDDHSLTVSSDALGTFGIYGHGGTSAQKQYSGTVAGNIWDNFDGTAGVTATRKASKSGNNLMKYKLPTIVDDVALSVSYQAGGTSHAGAASSKAYGLEYTGIEGLTASFGMGDDNSTLNNKVDVTSWKASYVYESITVGASRNDYSPETAQTDEETTSWNVAYTISDNISVAYGIEEISNEANTADSEYTSLSGSYTSGGMTVSVGHQTAEAGAGASTDKDVDYNYLTLAFAF
jgi:outer membrane protein OmpU